MKLKICGVRNMQMALACQDTMVDYIGLNFVPTSKRKINAILGQKLSHAFTGKKVGVFMNQSIKEILEVLSIVDLDIIQLHGNETPDFIKKILHHLPSTTGHQPLIWKTFSVDEKFNSSQLQQYSKNCHIFLFDGIKPGSGDPILDKKKLQQAVKESQKLDIKYGLAGGINANTAPDFLKTFPDADFLDTASGVEENGQFSRDKLEAMATIMHDE